MSPLVWFRRHVLRRGAHGLRVGDRVRLDCSSELPRGVSRSTSYRIVNVTSQRISLGIAPLRWYHRAHRFLASLFGGE